MNSANKKTLAKEILYFFSVITLLLLIWVGIEIRNKAYENKINILKKEISEFQFTTTLVNQRLAGMVIKEDEYGIIIRPSHEGNVNSDKSLFLDNVYISFINEGYKGSKSDFITLIKKNQAALNDAYKLSSNLGFKKGVNEFHDSLLSGFKEEQDSTTAYTNKLKVLNKSIKIANKNLLDYETKFLGDSEIKMNMLYCIIILFGFLYPFRLVYKSVKWAFLTLKKEDS